MGKIIISTLISILPFTQLSHPHEEDPFTTYIQEKLIELGYLEVATGVNDKTSQAAIKLFQEKSGLIVDGMVGESTFLQLMLAEKPIDNDSSVTTSSDENIVIDDKPPVWDETQPPFASEIGSLFNLNMPSVTDNVSIVSYEVYVNGALSTYATISDTRLLVTPKYDMTCADQIIYVIAYDSAGNSSQSPSFTIPQSDPCISATSANSNTSSSGFLLTFGGSGIETDIAGIAVDSSDNIYITGTSLGTNVYGANVTSGTNDDIFVAKLNSSGEVQWVYTAGGTGRDRGRKIALDSSGNIYVVGYYRNVVDFGGGNETSNGNWDAFLLKLNNSGTFQWVKSFGDTLNDLGRDVVVDSNDNVYMLGDFRGTVTFPSIASRIASSADMFVLKVNSSGDNVRLYTGASTSGDESARAMAIDSSDNLYITGSFSGTMNFGDGNNVTASFSHDLFIVKLNSDLQFQNIYLSSISTAQKAKGIAVDSSGNIYATGNFNGTVDFGGGLLNRSSQDIYLLKLDSNFTFQWVKTFSDTNQQSDPAMGTAIAIDEDGNVYSGGGIGDTIRIGDLSLDGANNRAYILKHDSSGNLLWSKTFGGGTADASDKMQDIAIDSNGFLITAGQIQGPASFVSVGASEGQSIGGVTDDYSWVLKIKSDTGLID